MTTTSLFDTNTHNSLSTMATIEPRLIHLLNGSTTPQLSHNDLPPLHALSLPDHADGPLPPLDREANHRGSSKTHHSMHLGSDTYTTAAGSSTAYPLRMLLGESENIEHLSMLSTRDSSPDSQDDGSYKKRSRQLTAKDDFVQLPQPMKKQKAAQQAHAMPPIINGLHEPPPHAALFPPISSTSFDESDQHQMRLMHDVAHSPEDFSGRRSSPETDKGSSKGRKRATKPRRKWSEEETNHLLLGVNRHGVGKWTSILEDPDFYFNDRTAGDLKDRFRTCCPDELRTSSKSKSSSSSRSEKSSKSKSSSSSSSSKKGIHSENILIEEEESPRSSSSKSSSESPVKTKKSRAHRKNLEDLAELGIHGPFKKSHRRERRPFTEQDDHEILEGLDMYGPAWTKIQRDARFHLSSRQPTDLRDRVRNKYPSIYQRIEKGTFQTRDSGRGNDVLEPSVNMSIDNSLKRSKEDLPRWSTHAALDSGDYSQQAHNFEFGEAHAPHFIGGEMDISRLLLDDSRMSSSSRHGMESLSGPSSPTGIAMDSRRERFENYSLKC